jgi:hypothetical protein
MDSSLVHFAGSLDSHNVIDITQLVSMQSEHPSDEANFVIQRGRVLGGLEPTRAFGDARYKWPKDVGNK